MKLFYCFLWRMLLCVLMHPEAYPLWNVYKQITYGPLNTTVCLCWEVMYVSMQPHRANADLSTALKCLASGRKSVEGLSNIAPGETSAVELLLVCYFCILLMYHCALYLQNADYTTWTWTLSNPLPTQPAYTVVEAVSVPYTASIHCSWGCICSLHSQHTL